MRGVASAELADAVYTSYARDRGHALIDRDLYARADWFEDPARMAAAGFPKDHAFATPLRDARTSRAAAMTATMPMIADNVVMARLLNLRLRLLA